MNLKKVEVMEEIINRIIEIIKINSKITKRTHNILVGNSKKKVFFKIIKNHTICFDFILLN